MWIAAACAATLCAVLAFWHPAKARDKRKRRWILFMLSGVALLEALPPAFRRLGMQSLAEWQTLLLTVGGLVITYCAIADPRWSPARSPSGRGSARDAHSRPVLRLVVLAWGVWTLYYGVKQVRRRHVALTRCAEMHAAAIAAAPRHMTAGKVQRQVDGSVPDTGLRPPSARGGYRFRPYTCGRLLRG